MAGFLNGYVEWRLNEDWRYLTTVQPFTGSQTSAKYVLLGIKWARYLETPSDNNSIPDDVSSLTKINMMSYWSGAEKIFEGENVEERYSTYKGSIGTTQVMSLEDINKFDWDKGISEENLERLKEDVRENEHFDFSYLTELFEVHDGAGNVYEARHYEDGVMFKGNKEDYNLSQEEVRDLILEEQLEYKSKRFILRKKTRREILPRTWFDLTELLNLRYGQQSKDTRFILYWTH